MLLLCRPGLTPADLARIESKLAGARSPSAQGVRWGRRGDRLVLVLDGADPDDASTKDLREDPAIEYVLKDPSAEETARIVSRRDVLDLAIASTGAVAAAVVLAPLGFYLSARGREGEAGEETRVGRADAVPVGGSQSRIVDGEEVVIVRSGEDRWHCLSATCTHSDVCLVAWDGRRRQLVCPCHRGTFDLHGNVLSGPPPRPLASREVRVRDGELWVRRRKA